MKKYCFLVLLCLTSSILFANPRIAVLDFEANGVSEMEVRVFTDFITSYFVETGKYSVIDRSQRDTILSELEFSLSGCADESCQLEIGKLLAADQLVIGSIGLIGDVIVLNIKVIEVESAITLFTEFEKYKDINDLVKDTEFLVNSITAKQFGEIAELDRSQRTVLQDSDLIDEYTLSNPESRHGGSFDAGFNITRLHEVELDNFIFSPFLGASYQFNNWFSFAVHVGIAFLQEKYICFPPEIETDEGFRLSSFQVSLKLIGGNKVDSLAGFIGLSSMPLLSIMTVGASNSDSLFHKTNIIPEIGLYYKNIFISVQFLPFQSQSIFGISGGYSFFSQKRGNHD